MDAAMLKKYCIASVDYVRLLFQIFFLYIL